MENEGKTLLQDKEDILKNIDELLEDYPLLMTRKEAMKVLEVSRPTITRMIKNKIIKGVKVTPNSHLKIAKISIKNYLIELHTGK